MGLIVRSETGWRRYVLTEKGQEVIDNVEEHIARLAAAGGRAAITAHGQQVMGPV